MKEYKGIYLPTKRHRKPREYKFETFSDKRAAVLFLDLCSDAGWKMLNVFTDEGEALFKNGVLNV